MFLVLWHAQSPFSFASLPLAVNPSKLESWFL